MFIYRVALPLNRAKGRTHMTANHKGKIVWCVKCKMTRLWIINGNYIECDCGASMPYTAPKYSDKGQ